MLGISGPGTDTQYIYKPLIIPKENAYEVRFVELLPAAEQTEQLQCQIRHESLKSQVSTTVSKLGSETEFEALSYVWGNDTPFDRIAIESGYILIGQNLSNALRSLRYTGQTRLLWIDAICINQNDLDEKSAQVSLMYRIYSQAKNVIIHLEMPTPEPRGWDVGSAFSVARTLAKLEESRSGVILEKSMRYRQNRYRALRLFFNQPWFERIWVVQEVACARHAIIVCGKQSTCWHDFMKGIDFGLRSGIFKPDWIRNFFPIIHQKTPQGKLSAALHMYHLNSRRGLHPHHDARSIDVQASAGSEDLFTSLRRFHGSQASNPRDKLFALLGLASLSGMERLQEDLLQLNIKPDYGIEVKHLFCRLAEAILSISGSLDLLSIPCSRADWPSWVPDWSIRSQQTEALSYSRPSGYHSSGNSKPHPLVDGDVLVLRGIFIDSIDRIVDRNVTQRYKKFNNRLRKLPRAVDQASIDSIIQLALICEHVLEWEFLEPSEYPSGENRNNIYMSLLDAARASHKSPWYASSRRSIIRLKLITIIQRLATKYPTIFSILPRRRRCAILLGMISAAEGIFDGDILQSKTIARTARGYLVYAPFATRVGDQVAIFQGGRVPFIVHRDEIDGPFRLRGECCIPGMMKGELWCEEQCHEIRIA